MSRWIIACSLLAALSSSSSAALADRATMSFARPPAGWAGASSRPDDTAFDTAPVAVLDRAAVRARLLEQRAANLERFRAYYTAGAYPSNVFTPGLANVWRDQDGRYCAAATIIRASGQARLAEDIAAKHNDIKLADVTSGPLLDWILTSGLTQAELALIQRPFMPVTKRPELRPVRPILVDARLRAAETRRLARLYAEIEARLVAGQERSLEAAVDRLMARPALARELIGG